MRVDDVKKFATQLRGEGIEAFEYGESNPNGDGIRIGIQVVELGFFSIEELNDPSNERLVAAREFATIKTKRETAQNLFVKRQSSKR